MSDEGSREDSAGDGRVRDATADAPMAALWQALFETATDAIIIHERESGRILEANHSAAELYGYTTHELSGMSVFELTAEPDETRTSLERGETRIPMRYHVAKDGRIFPVEVTANQFTWLGTEVRVAFIRDISERVAAAETLRASESKFATAFRTSPDAININRLSDGLYIEVNEGFTKLTGYTAEDVAGKTSSDIGIWEDPAARDRLVRGLREHGSVENLEARFRLKNGDVRTGLMSARVITIDGEFCILSVTRDITERKAAEEALERSYRELDAAVHGITEALGRTVEVRDPYTGGHERRVAALCRMLAKQLGLAEHETKSLEMAALIHDVGKVAIPADILSKPARLTEVEYRIVQEHSARGFEILSGIEVPWPLAEIVLQHHERVDGTGYPAGLRGEEISREARILAAADVIEAMSSHRPYRPALGVDAAIAELREHAGSYDADVVAACVELHKAGELAFLSA